ncbi:hypothetical protein V8G54_028777 [Vigna mungo]|uniref:Uncharacterized protein n=1 Tax=Vigna mungo TaxID=3915 RepID=A0AAQ3RJP4_VIGMU
MWTQRGEVWITTHKNTNEAFVSDETRKIGVRKKNLKHMNPQHRLNKKKIQFRLLAHALGIQEHCGRVRGLGLGPCPSKIFGVKARSLSGSSSTAPFNVELQTQVSSLTSQVNNMTSQVNEMISFMLQNYQGQLPSKFAAFQPSVSDQGSVLNDECNEDEEN